MASRKTSNQQRKRPECHTPDLTITPQVVGGHSTANGNITIVSVTKPSDKNGVYEAVIAVKDPKTGNLLSKTNSSNGRSTMFPNSWSGDRIKVEVDYAYKNRIPHPDPKLAAKGMWFGRTPSGVAVQGYLRPKVTAYPVYNK